MQMQKTSDSHKELKDFDKDYRASIQLTHDELVKSHDNIFNQYTFDLRKTEITVAILERLKIYYSTHTLIKQFLGKRYLAAGADYFVETVLFYLRLFLLSKKVSLQAHSEKQIKRAKKAIRPDISIWNEDNIVATIECKTQLGWNRQNWEQEQSNREFVLKKDFPNATSFLLVMTEKNWSGFGNHQELGNKYFSLLNEFTWITDFSDVNQIRTPIESLFNKILNLSSS